MTKYKPVTISELKIGDLVKVSDKVGGYMNGRNFKGFIVSMDADSLTVEPQRLGGSASVTVKRDTIVTAERAHQVKINGEWVAA